MIDHKELDTLAWVRILDHFSRFLMSLVDNVEAIDLVYPVLVTKASIIGRRLVIDTVSLFSLRSWSRRRLTS